MTLALALASASLAHPFWVLDRDPPTPVPALAPAWSLHVGVGQAVYPEGPQDERFIRAWLPLVRHQEGWAVGLSGTHAWGAQGPGWAQGLGLAWMRAHGPLWSQLGLGVGRFRFQMPDHEAQITPAGMGTGAVGLNWGPFQMGVEVNVWQAPGWAWRGGSEVLYPARFGAFWYGGLGW